MEYKKPDTLDFMNALKVLYPYKDRLKKISEAQKNGEFDQIEITDPWSALTSFRDSDAYKTYNIKELSQSLYMSMMSIEKYGYDHQTYDHIHELLGTQYTGDFSKWTLPEVYYYLTMLFEDLRLDGGIMDEIIIENAIIRGDILDIINCFLERI